MFAHNVGMRQLVDVPECPERPELKLTGSSASRNGEPDHKLLFIMDQDSLLLEKDVAHPYFIPGISWISKSSCIYDPSGL